MGVPTIKCILNGKYELILPKHRADRPEWYTEEGWEKKRIDSMFETVNEGDVVFYVGVEEGDIAALLAKWGAQLVLFEPNDKVWPNVKMIWDANNLKKPLASFSGFAANETDLKGTDLVWGDFPKSAIGPVIGNHGFKELAYEADVIPQIKIDDVIRQLKVRPAMITLDVEGSEFEVLKGAADTLKQYKPDIYLSLHPEFLFRMFDVYAADLRNWVKGFGYKEILLDYQHEVHLYYTGIQ